MYEMLSDERRSRMEFVLRNRQPDWTIILENVHDPHNIAAVMRTCDSVGIQDLFIVNTDGVKAVDYNSENYRSSRSAHKWLTIHQYDNLDECMSEVSAHYENILCTHLSDDSQDIYSMDFVHKSLAIVFGNEQHGVSVEMLDYCNGNIIIPQVGMIKSLNISVACAVTLYEIFRQKKQAGHYENSAYPNDKLEQLRFRWSEKKEKKRY